MTNELARHGQDLHGEVHCLRGSPCSWRHVRCLYLQKKSMKTTMPGHEHCHSATLCPSVLLYDPGTAGVLNVVCSGDPVWALEPNPCDKKRLSGVTFQMHPLANRDRWA